MVIQRELIVFVGENLEAKLNFLIRPCKISKFGSDHGILLTSLYEPRHEKTCFSHMRKTKVQISLRIRVD